MAGELHRLTVRFDADTTAFNAALKTSEQRVKTFSDSAVTSIGKQSKAERDLAHDMKRKIELEKEWQAAQAKRNQRAEFLRNSEVVNGFQKIDTAAKSTTRTMLSSTSAFRSLSSNLTTVAASMLPVNAGLLRVGSTLGMLALTGPMMVGALAGLAALSFAWDKVSASSKKAAEATEQSVKRVDALMARLRDTDLALVARDIVEEEARKADLVRKLGDEDRARADAIGMGITQPRGIRDRQERLNEIEEVRKRLEALRNEERRLIDMEISEDAKEHADAEKERAAALKAAAAAAKAAEKDLNAYIAALTTLVEAGFASAEQTAELRAAQAGFAATLRDGTAGAEAQAAALQQLTRMQKAFTEARLRDIQVASIGTAGAAGGDLLRAPRSISFMTTAGTLPTPAGGGIGDIFKDIGGQLTGALSAMPQQLLTSVLSQITGSILNGITGGIGKLLGFGDGESQQMRAARELQIAAERQMQAAQELLKSTYSIRNLPMNFSGATARTRIASGGGISINSVTIAASPTGDTPATLWRKFEQGLAEANAGGNVLARSLSVGNR